LADLVNGDNCPNILAGAFYGVFGGRAPIIIPGSCRGLLAANSRNSCKGAAKKACKKLRLDSDKDAFSAVEEWESVSLFTKALALVGFVSVLYAAFTTLTAHCCKGGEYARINTPANV